MFQKLGFAAKKEEVIIIGLKNLRFYHQLQPFPVLQQELT